jgi:hypothetical protein
MNRIIRAILGKKSVLLRNVDGKIHVYCSKDMTGEEVIDYLASATVKLSDPIENKLLNLKNRNN